MTPRGAARLAAAVLVSSSLFPAFASSLTLPSGLTPGQGYHLMFITSTQEAAASTDIADYDAFVQGVANTTPDLASLNLTWYAVASTPSTDNWEGIAGSNDPVYSLDGTLLQSTLTSAFLLATPTFEDGSPYTSSDFTEPFVWTGSGSNGARYCGGNCALGQSNAAFGDPTNANFWLLDSTMSTTTSLSFYAVSNEIIYTAPEPGTLPMAVFGVLALVFLTRRNRHAQSDCGRGH